jgi:hypothetical protein
VHQAYDTACAAAGERNPAPSAAAKMPGAIAKNHIRRRIDIVCLIAS